MQAGGVQYRAIDWRVRDMKHANIAVMASGLVVLAGAAGPAPAMVIGEGWGGSRPGPPNGLPPNEPPTRGVPVVAGKRPQENNTDSRAARRRRGKKGAQS